MRSIRQEGRAKEKLRLGGRRHIPMSAKSTRIQLLAPHARPPRNSISHPRFLAAGAVILALSGYLAHSVTFYYVASVGSIVAVLSLGIFYLAYRSLSRRSDRRALGKTFGALSLGLAWVFNKGWDYFVYWYTQTLIWCGPAACTHSGAARVFDSGDLIAGDVLP